MLATAAAQATFALLVLATERRHPAELADRGRGGTTIERPRVADDPAAAPSTRRLLRSRFVALILAYQVLSALGSQLSDFLVLDRATAQYPATADLARFMAGYTAVMNAVAIAFLFVLAGPLLQRFGLRLGVVANPFVVTILAVGMLVVYALSGAGSLALLAIASATRIADIALTDGTTRTSINAMYQVLPGRGRLAVQTTVEGIGVPFAIGDLRRADPGHQRASRRPRGVDRRHHPRVRHLDVGGRRALPRLRARAGRRAGPPQTPRSGRRVRSDRRPRGNGA